jgi:hypothetical protein
VSFKTNYETVVESFDDMGLKEQLLVSWTSLNFWPLRCVGAPHGAACEGTAAVGHTGAWWARV